jgi:LuxR family maltose regulon positive regulatory protein
MRECSLLALEAPAGFGKTSLLNQWRREALRRGAIAVWLALDERDTPDRLVRGLRIALLLGCGADAPGHAIERLRVPRESPLDAATAWLADVASLAREVVLLADDLHAMPKGMTQDLLDYVVLNAPANLKIVLGSRVSVPASVLNVAPHGHLAILRTDELRLSGCEVERILRLQLGPRFDPALCARLFELSGGWPLGLQLMVSNLRDQSDGSRSIASMSATSGDVSLYFQEYLDERLAPDLADFLLRISITDVISAGLAEALTGRADSAALLTQLSTMTPIFGQVMTREWLRMHSLALEFLRDRALHTFNAQELEALHVAAANWLADNGMPEPAARHAFAAGQAEAAFDLAELCLPEILANGDLARVLDWFDRLALVDAKRRPGIAASAAWALAMFVDRRDEALPLIDAVLENPAAAQGARANAGAARLYHALTQDDIETGQALYDRWLPERGKGHTVLDEMLTTFSAFLALCSGQPALARYECQRALNRGAAQPFFVTQSSLTVMVASSHYWEGRVQLAEEVLRPRAEAALARLGRRSPSSTMWDVALATVLWERDDTESAAALMHERLDLLERVQDFRLTTVGFITAARVALHAGNEAKALHVVEHLGTLGEKRHLPCLRWESLAEQIRIHAHAGRGKVCAQLLVRMEAIATAPSVGLRSYSLESLNLSLSIARSYTAIAEQDFRAAAVHLDEADWLATRLQRGRDSIVIKLLTSLVQRRLGEEGDELLAEALSLANSCGLKRVVRDTHPDLVPVVEALLKRTMPGLFSVLQADADDTTGSRRLSAKVPGCPAASLLTPKEHEVLWHLAESATNKRIATVLEVSEETVKWHLKNLFAKLGGANRKHVVERARQFGLIE